MMKVFASKTGMIHRTGASHRYGSCDHLKLHCIPLKSDYSKYRFCKLCCGNQIIQKRVLLLLKAKIYNAQRLFSNHVRQGNKVIFEEAL